MLGFYETVRSTLSREKMIRSKVADRAHSFKISLRKASALLFASKKNMEDKDGEIAR